MTGFGYRHYGLFTLAMFFGKNVTDRVEYLQKLLSNLLQNLLQTLRNLYFNFNW